MWYELKNALMIIQDERPKILCAHFLKDLGSGKQTELHMTACREVPPHVKRLWQPGTTNDAHV